MKKRKNKELNIMKDYIITAITVFIMVSGILLCHKYTLNIEYELDKESISNSEYNIPHETKPYSENNNNFIPVQTTAPPARNEENKNNNIPPQNTTNYIALPEASDITEIVTTEYKSILERATESTTAKHFNIIKNPERPVTETTPVIPGNFSLTID